MTVYDSVMKLTTRLKTLASDTTSGCGRLSCVQFSYSWCVALTTSGWVQVGMSRIV